MTQTLQIQITMLRIKEDSMKKIFSIIFLLVVVSTATGCKQKLIDENIALKAKVAVLEQQLKLCKGGVAKPQEGVLKYDPNVTNPNNNASY